MTLWSKILEDMVNNHFLRYACIKRVNLWVSVIDLRVNGPSPECFDMIFVNVVYVECPGTTGLQLVSTDTQRGVSGVDNYTEGSSFPDC